MAFKNKTKKPFIIILKFFQIYALFVALLARLVILFKKAAAHAVSRD